MDAGQGVLAVGEHAFTGGYRRNVNTGQMQYRPSLVMAAPMFLWKLAHAEPKAALTELINGVHSGMEIPADVVGVASNAVVNPVFQSTLGFAVSPGAADTAGHWLGALTQAVAQDLPFAERSADALSPVSLYYHNRGFSPVAYTRTDTQLNIDRIVAIANMAAIGAIVHKVSDGGGGSGRSGDGGGGNGGGGNGGGGAGGGGGGGNGGACVSRGAPHGTAASPNLAQAALAVLGTTFCNHPVLNFLLPVRF